MIDANIDIDYPYFVIGHNDCICALGIFSTFMQDPVIGCLGDCQSGYLLPAPHSAARVSPQLWYTPATLHRKHAYTNLT